MRPSRLVQLGTLSDDDVALIRSALDFFLDTELGPAHGFEVMDGLVTFYLSSSGRVEVLECLWDLTDDLHHDFVICMSPANDCAGMVVYVGNSLPLTQIDN